MKIFSKSRPSLTILFVIIFWLIYLVFSVTFFNRNLREGYLESIEQRKLEISYLAKNALRLFQGSGVVSNNSQKFEDSLMFEYLRSSLELEKISFFRFNDNLVVLERVKNPTRDWFGREIPFAEVMTETLKKITPSDQQKAGVQANMNPIFRDDTIYQHLAICPIEGKQDNCVDQNQVDQTQSLTIGLLFPMSEFAWRNYERFLGLIVFDLMIVSLLAGFVIWITTKDIRSLSKSLQTGQRKNIFQISNLTEEGTTLLLGTQGFEQKNKQLTQSNFIYQNQTSPAIRYQLGLNNKLPSKVDCTLARVDLNGYTRLFLESDPNDLVQLLNKYFEISRKCIERYGGQIYQYVGDEILFLILNGSIQDNVDSRQLALASIRDLAESIKEIKIEDKIYGLKIKSSFVQGQLQFVKLDQGYAFTGMPLIESVRILGQIQDKKDDSLIIYQEDLRSLDTLIDKYEVQESKTLKGFSKSSTLVEVRKFKNWKEVSQHSDPKKYLTHFRNESALIWNLETILDELEDGKFDLPIELWNHLQSVAFEARSELIHGLVKDVLDLLWESKSEIKSYRTCARFISLIPRIDINLRANDLTRQSLERFTNHEDFRIQSNTLQTLASLDEGYQVSRERYDSLSNRIAADALMIAGRSGVDQEIFKYIDRFLTHHDPLFRASGLFVATHLIEFHFQKDLVYFNANPWLQKLLYLVKNFHDEVDPIVTKRSQISKSIIEDVEKQLKNSDSDQESA